MFKQHLCCFPGLRNPDCTKEFRLRTDVSEYGVGAVLSQVNDPGDEHTVAYCSYKPLPTEQKYATIEKECLAIMLACEAF